MKKVKIKCSWTSDDLILNRLLSQFKTSEKDLSNIIFSDNDYDIIIFFGYINSDINNKATAYVLPQEPTWSGNHQKQFPKHNNLIIYGYDKNNYSIQDTIKENVSLMFYGGRGDTQEIIDYWTYDKIFNFNQIKTHNISSIVSSLGDLSLDIPYGSLYNKRCNLIKYLIENTSFIDIFSWQNNGKNVKGWLDKKIHGLDKYRFSLCIENSSEKNYISEKFYDCILTNTIPIYYGCKNIKDFLPENGYFYIDNIDNVENILDLLIDINTNADSYYNKMLPELQKIKQKYFDIYNPLKIINNLSS
jgi:hypothetical protein